MQKTGSQRRIGKVWRAPYLPCDLTVLQRKPPSTHTK
jgi:hypothetical protein